MQAYLDKKEQYGKLLVFAINKIHAIELNKLFRERGVASEFVISSVPSIEIDIDLSTQANREKIRKFKDNELDVLINVNILTEGTDLPDVQTVFLTRPTTSPVLMTQMVGRALRGKEAGGTEKAYIVSFVDEWKNKIAWVNPSNLFPSHGTWTDKDIKKDKGHKMSWSIKNIEEFIKKADEAIDKKDLVSLDFKKISSIGHLFVFC
ncbi:MAG: hypothetical protein LRY71_00245 [Bacillaceae bacterium]|nr:hypothetical protein [Bacillaceae bacterium]